MPKSKSAMMRHLRRQRKEQGLVELRVHLTPEQKRQALEYIERLTMRVSNNEN